MPEAAEIRIDLRNERALRDLDQLERRFKGLERDGGGGRGAGGAALAAGGRGVGTGGGLGALGATAGQVAAAAAALVAIKTLVETLLPRTVAAVEKVAAPGQAVAEVEGALRAAVRGGAAFSNAELQELLGPSLEAARRETDFRSQLRQIRGFETVGTIAGLPGDLSRAVPADVASLFSATWSGVGLAVAREHY